MASDKNQDHRAVRIEVISTWRGIRKRQCTVCKEWKNIVPPIEMVRGRVRSEPDSRFSWRLIERRNDVAIVSPMGKCRRCKAKQSLANRKRKIEQIGYEEFARQRREYQKQRKQNPEIYESERRYARLWWRMNHGKGKRVWPQYTDEIGGRLPLVNAFPFVEWWQSLNGDQPTEEDLGDTLARAIRRATSGEVKKIHLDLIDEAGVVVGVPHLIHVLYPNN